MDESKLNSQQLEAQIREELERQQTAKANEEQSIKAPKCPGDIDEFKDYLGYNLENIGVPNGDEYYALLERAFK